jgi:hypothetical protein
VSTSFPAERSVPVSRSCTTVRILKSMRCDGLGWKINACRAFVTEACTSKNWKTVIRKMSFENGS